MIGCNVFFRQLRDCFLSEPKQTLDREDVRVAPVSSLPSFDLIFRFVSNGTLECLKTIDTFPK